MLQTARAVIRDLLLYDGSGLKRELFMTGTGANYVQTTGIGRILDGFNSGGAYDHKVVGYSW